MSSASRSSCGRGVFLNFTFGADGQSHPALRPCIFGPMRNPNTTKDQENLLVALANQRRVVGLTLPNSSGGVWYVHVCKLRGVSPQLLPHSTCWHFCASRILHRPSAWSLLLWALGWTDGLLTLTLSLTRPYTVEYSIVW